MSPLISNSLGNSLRILWWGQFLSIAGLTMMVPLLPFYMKELGAADTAEALSWAGLALAAPAVTHCLTAPLWGRVGDRWGRKWMVVRALLGLSLSLLLMGLAQTPLAFLLCRLLQGACGGVVDASSAYAASEAPEAERGRVLGRLQSATAAGSLCGPLLGGISAGVLGYGSLLLIMSGLTTAVALAAAWGMREQRQAVRGGNSRAPRPLRGVFADLLQSSRTRRLILAGLLAQVGIYGLVAVFAPHVEAMLKPDAPAAAWVGALHALAWAAGMFGAPWWGKRNDRRAVEDNMFQALAVCGLSIALQALPQEAYWLVPLRILQGFAFSALLQSVFLVVARESEDDSRGERMGAANSLLVAGQIIGSLLGGFVGGFWPTSFVVAATGMLFLCGAICVMTAPNDSRAPRWSAAWNALWKGGSRG